MCSFLLTILLFAFTSTTMAEFTDEDCKEIKAKNTQCECLSSINDLSIQCPVNATDPQIEVQIKNMYNYVTVRIDYNNIDSYKLLPAIHIGIVNKLTLSHYPLSSEPISHILHQLGITYLKDIEIVLSDQLKVNITRHHLSGFTDLDTLTIDNFDLPHAPDDLFTELPNLAHLYLVSTNSQLKHNVSAYTTDLTISNFNSKNLVQLPEGIFRNQRQLASLIIKCTTLQYITKDLFIGLKSIINLGLSKSRIESINSDVFSSLKDLQIIDLSYNELKMANPTLFAQQRDLFLLNLSHNKLQSLPDELFRGKNGLTRLDLSYNQLTEISSGIFSSLINLSELYMNNNRLMKISPNAFVSATKLTTVNMENNLLSDTFSNQKDISISHKLISPFNFLVKLKTLNLSNNTLSYIFSDWHKMYELKKLNLSYNNITSLGTSNSAFNKFFSMKRMRFSTIPDIFTNKLGSYNKLDINLSHNKIHNINFKKIGELTKSLQMSGKRISLRLNNNPLNCDCNLLLFVQYVREKPHREFNLVIDELVCQKPENMKDLNVSYIEPKALLCPFDFRNFEPEHCPHNCSCWERTYGSILTVNCSARNLKSVPVLPRVQTLPFQSIALHIENNEIHQLPTVSTNGYADVTEIYAAGNNLSQLDINNLPKNLTYLDLSRNKFNELNDKVLIFFNQSTSPKQVALSGNPWNCECKNRPLLVFVTYSNKSNTKITDIDNVNCTSPTNYKMTDYHIINDICKDDQIVIITPWGIIAFLGFLIGLIFGLYHKYKIEIKIWMYKYRICACCVNEEELDKDKIYDAFVSFSHKDVEFVAKHLVPELEEGPIRFKLCIHERDFVIGECIPDQIVRAIDNSRRTIIVLSENFINSVWAQLEFRQAHQAGLNEGRARLIIVLYGEIGDINPLDKDLKAYLSMNTYLEWGNPWFWDRLRYAMPHPSRKLNNSVQRLLGRNEDDNIELNEIPMVEMTRENDV